MKRAFAVLAIIIGVTIGARADEMKGMKMTPTAGEATVKGEVVDMACYLDHGASGPKHVDCAGMCIKAGLPVGIKASDGKTYLLIGEHKPINDELVAYAGKTITVKGKMVSRDGINMIENAQIQK